MSNSENLSIGFHKLVLIVNNGQEANHGEGS